MVQGTHAHRPTADGDDASVLSHIRINVPVTLQPRRRERSAFKGDTSGAQSGRCEVARTTNQKRGVKKNRDFFGGCAKLSLPDLAALFRQFTHCWRRLMVCALLLDG